DGRRGGQTVADGERQRHVAQHRAARAGSGVGGRAERVGAEREVVGREVVSVDVAADGPRGEVFGADGGAVDLPANRADRARRVRLHRQARGVGGGGDRGGGF